MQHKETKEVREFSQGVWDNLPTHIKEQYQIYAEKAPVEVAHLANKKNS